MHSKLLVAAVAAIAQLGAGQSDTGSKIHCPGFIAEEIAYPTPYISSQDRSDRCKALFSRFNSTGTANFAFPGQNTYQNPCKIDCALCANDELPDEREEAHFIHSYPPHATLKDSIVKCPDEVEVFEQYMPEGTRCGAFHLCENKCCVAKPERFPNSKRVRAKIRTKAGVNPIPQEIPAEWTKPLTCEEEGFYQNPNDCHKFYRCYKSGKKFARTLFECNPPTLVFDSNVKVCVKAEADTLDEICGVFAGPEASHDY